MITNTELLARLDTAFKGITEIDSLGESILQPAKFDRFVRQMEHATTVLPEARFLRMNSHKVDIDRVGFVSRILRAGRKPVAGSTEVRELTTDEFAVASTFTNQLIAKELFAITSLRDDALRRNIERGDFEATLIDLFGAAAGRDLEEVALLGDTKIPFADDDVLNQIDGWARRAEHKLYGVKRAAAGDVPAAPADFDPKAAEYPENMLDALLKTLPKQFLGNPGEWRYYVTWDVYNAYRDKLRARGTQLGDAAQTTAAPLYFKGIAVKYTPFLERARAVGTAGTDIIEGKIAMLSNPANMAWGVFHQVLLEQEREAKLRRTDFVLTFEGDADFEDENAAVVALVQKSRPA